MQPKLVYTSYPSRRIVKEDVDYWATYALICKFFSIRFSISTLKPKFIICGRLNMIWILCWLVITTFWWLSLAFRLELGLWRRPIILLQCRPFCWTLAYGVQFCWGSPIEGSCLGPPSTTSFGFLVREYSLKDFHYSWEDDYYSTSITR